MRSFALVGPKSPRMSLTLDAVENNSAHVMSHQREWAASPETNLSNERAELLRKRAPVIAFRTGGFGRVPVAAHVGHKYRQPCTGQSVHQFAPTVTRAQEAVPEEDGWTIGVASKQIV
jgi:hypothetical protein